MDPQSLTIFIVLPLAAATVVAALLLVVCLANTLLLVGRMRAWPALPLLPCR